MNDKDWIPIEDSLPDDSDKRYGIDVLVVVLHYDTAGRTRRSKSAVVFKEGYFRHQWFGEPIGEKIFQKVTHWMYWPDLPKKYKKPTQHESKVGKI